MTANQKFIYVKQKTFLQSLLLRTLLAKGLSFEQDQITEGGYSFHQAQCRHFPVDLLADPVLVLQFFRIPVFRG